MTWIKNNSKVAGGNATMKTNIRKGQTYMFDSFEKAYAFCMINNIDVEKIVPRYTTYKIEI